MKWEFNYPTAATDSATFLFWIILTCCVVIGCADVRGLEIKFDDYQIHDVSNALKRFFRTLDAPLLTLDLYPHWISAAGWYLDFFTFYHFCCFATNLPVSFFFVEN